MTINSADKMRIGGSKVRTGCQTCKTRRVKCDEGKPNCQRCVKGGRSCEGYVSVIKSAASLPVGHRFVLYYVEPQRMNSPDAAELDLQARRALDFFRHQTAFQLDQPFTIDLWSKSLACIMQHEPAIKHGVIALATLHENFMQLSRTEEYEERKILALQHYGKSINAVVQLNAKDFGSVSATTLITCLLYCLIESLQGHFHSSSKHVIAGIQLLADIDRGILCHEKAVRDIPEPLLDLLRRIFINLGTQAMALGEPSVNAATLENVRQSHQIASRGFATTDTALAELSQIIDDDLRALTWADRCGINVEQKPPITELAIAREALKNRLSDWQSAYHSLLSKIENDRDTPSDEAGEVALLILRVNHLLCLISMTGLWNNPQTVFDQYLDAFQTIVSSVEKILEIENRHGQPRRDGVRASSSHPTNPRPIFSVTLGVVPALLFTSTRCRHYQTRLQALQMLVTMKRRETCWDSQLVSWAAQRFVAIEEQRIADYRRERQSRFSRCPSEESAGSGSSSSSCDSSNMALTDTTDMPEHLRIHRLDIVFETESSAIMSFKNTFFGDRDDLLMEWND